ncbi:MAG: hypothetical protein MUO24_01230 [Desulfobacterales bacterium]|nr:hypothetical protein [Desulfobacterales bacterium]
MKKTFRFFIVIGLIFVTGCINTLPMHNPIYPTNGEDVTYNLNVSVSHGSIKAIKLYETVSSIDAQSTVTPGTESLLQEWNFTDTPNSTSVTFTKTRGYEANKLVQYRFLVKIKRNWIWSTSRSHDVSYATRPYPVPNQPAPVYVQGDVDHVFDVVFIPDTDITNMTTFRTECRNMITDAVFAESTVRNWNRQFNFYINHEPGTATDYDRIATDGLHQTPTNWANLSFAEVKVLMHQNNLRDYAYGGLFSTEMQNRGTMMHEGGHSMFVLADEYPGGAHWQEEEFPNNWSTLASAQADAPHRHKTAVDANEIGTTGWYKICNDNCQMNVSGLNLSNYDLPCGDRVIYMILDNAMNP